MLLRSLLIQAPECRDDVSIKAFEHGQPLEFALTTNKLAQHSHSGESHSGQTATIKAAYEKMWTVLARG